MTEATLALALPDEAATERFAAVFAGLLPADTRGWRVLLEGELGAGKSTFARALIRNLGHRGPVPSPTYTLVEPYELPGRQVYHVDLYRISSPEEVEYLGWSDWQDGLLLVEWPERAGQFLATADLRMVLEYQGEGRRARLSALSDRGALLVQDIHKASLAF
ncbi:MAG: tRNA (adenosine(37)-N6)-threonylcarbamoyltransferase complex ATPase subunit type 1 TsaE [Woeseiaceae bacterium]